ncbi:MAG: polyhydroxyalkanoic acid system family protein [Myxococcota bacterium]
MPDIRLSHPHALPPEEVKQRLHGFAELLGKYGVRLDWSGSNAKFAGVPGVGGDVQIHPTEVRVNVSLSRMITMMGLDPAKLEGTIRRRLAEALDPT